MLIKKVSLQVNVSNNKICINKKIVTGVKFD